MNAALEVERNRLVEFVQTLQKRLDHANTQLMEQESKLIEQRKFNARQEKEMEKLKLELNNVKNRTGLISLSDCFPSRLTLCLFSEGKRSDAHLAEIFLDAVGYT